MNRATTHDSNVRSFDATGFPLLPSGWCWTTVDELADVGTGTTPGRSISKYWDGGTIPWVTSTAVNELTVSEGNEFVTESALSETTLRVYPKHTLILALYGEGKTRGKISELLLDATINQALAALVLRGEGTEVRRYLKAFLLSNYVQMRRQAAGGMQPNLNLGIVKKIPVPLAPLNEQRRIVAKLEELFSDLDAGVAALERARGNLKRYRAVVLKAAVEGKLTEEWRTEHRDIEPAARLLDRILAERRRRWEADQLAKFAAGKSRPKNWQAKYPESDAADTSTLPALPRGWCWATVEQLGNVQLGRQRSPKNRSDKHPTKYIRAANITKAGLDLSDVLDMEFLPHELEIYRMRKGDVVLSEASGSPDQVGKPAVWNDEIPDCCFQNTVIRLRPNGISSRFALAVFHHWYVNKVFAKVAAGVGINHLSAGKFSVLPFPLPALAEQRQIVAEVDQRLSVADEAEQQIERSLHRAARLRQSILKRAFEGKLVPQDPNDEPASVLLEQLRLTQRAGDAPGSSKISELPNNRRANSVQSRRRSKGPRQAGRSRDALASE